MIKHLVLGAALVGASGSIANAGNGTNLTKYLPDTTQAVVAMDAQAARGSKLLQDSYAKLLASKPDAQAKMAALGIDPAKDVDTVLFAMGGATEMSKLGDGSVLMIVEGRLPANKIKSLPCDSKTTYSGVEICIKDDGEGAFLDGRLFFAKKGALKSTIDLVKGKGASLDKSGAGKGMRDAIAATNTKSHVWMSVLVPKKDRDMFAQAKVQAESFSITMNFSNDVAVGVRINTASEANAAQAVQMAQAFLPQASSALGTIGLGAAAKTLSVKQDKASVQASVKVTAAEIKTLVAMVTSKVGPTAPPGGGMSGAKK